MEEGNVGEEDVKDNVLTTTSTNSTKHTGRPAPSCTNPIIFPVIRCICRTAKKVMMLVVR